MLYGLYLSANGAAAQSTRLDVIANNLANADTTAFKRDLAVFQANRTFDAERGRAGGLPHQLHQHTGGTSIHSVETDYANGAIEVTGGMLDVAVTGPGFFKFTDGKNQYLSRDGRLEITPNGDLVSRITGDQLLDEQGNPIYVSPNAASVNIGPDGSLAEVDVDGRQNVVDRIGLHEPRDVRQLTKLGEGRFLDPEPTPRAGRSTQLKQGHLEASGTNPLTSMVQMIEATRAFETNLNMIQHQDNALGRLLQAIPR